MVCYISCKQGVPISLQLYSHWTSICLLQVLVDQKDCDEQIIWLASMMSDIYTFVYDAEPLKAIEVHMETITLLIKQVTECGYFITKYIKQKSFCQSSLVPYHFPLISASRASNGKVHIFWHQCEDHWLWKQAAQAKDQLVGRGCTLDRDHCHLYDEHSGGHQ